MKLKELLKACPCGKNHENDPDGEELLQWEADHPEDVAISLRLFEATEGQKRCNSEERRRMFKLWDELPEGELKSLMARMLRDHMDAVSAAAEAQAIGLIGLMAATGKAQVVELGGQRSPSGFPVFPQKTKPDTNH